MDLASCDFIAEIYYKLPIEGGRSTPAASGYRPTIKFPFDKMYTSGAQKFIDVDKVYPGQKVKAGIKIVSTAYFAGRLYEGLEFIFTEGTTVIGTGIIIEIINSSLKRPVQDAGLPSA